MLLVSLLLSSCSNFVSSESNELSDSGIATESDNAAVPNSPYQVLSYGYSDSIPSAKHMIEYIFADKEKYINTTPDDIVEVLINGISYSGEYQSNHYRSCNYFPVYEYISETGLSFAVDDSGMLVSFFQGNTSLQGPEKTKAECVAIAREFLASIVYVSNYDIDVAEDSERKMYTVTFVRRIGDLKTADTATIVVKSDGDLYSYSSFMLGRMAGKTVSPDSIDFQKIKESIYNKLSLIYQDAKSNYSRVEFGEPAYMLTALKDGSLGVVCTVDVDCINSYGEFGEMLSERNNFVVLID